MSDAAVDGEGRVPEARVPAPGVPALGVPGPGVPAAGVHPFRVHALQRAIIAPEIERYLSLGHVDVLYADQVEALAVRVRRGTDVLRSRIEHALGVAKGLRRRLVLSVAAALAAAAATGVLAALAEPGHLLLRLAAGGCGIAALACAIAVFLRLQSLRGDACRLMGVRARVDALAASLRALATREAVVALAAAALAEARDLGALASLEEA